MHNSQLCIKLQSANLVAGEDGAKRCSRVHAQSQMARHCDRFSDVWRLGHRNSHLGSREPREAPSVTALRGTR